MIAHPSEVPDVAPADGVAIVDARSRLDDVAAVASAGFDADRALTRRFVADAVFADRGARVYLATLDGRGVSTVETALQDGVLGVFGVATVPAARRRGIAGAITAYAVRDRAEDADLAFLQSSEMGRGVYERIGFRDVSTWEVWARA